MSSELKAFCVRIENPSDGGNDRIFVAAKSHNAAKFHVVSTIYENYFSHSIPMGRCFRYIKSVKRETALDDQIDQNRRPARQIFYYQGQEQ